MDNRIVTFQTTPSAEKDLRIVQDFLGTKQVSAAVRYALKIAAEKIKK